MKSVILIWIRHLFCKCVIIFKRDQYSFRRARNIETIVSALQHIYTFMVSMGRRKMHCLVFPEHKLSRTIVVKRCSIENFENPY